MTPVPSPPRSDCWYEDSDSDSLIRSSLRGDAHADVCIIGGGLLGVSTALHLAEFGLDVVLIEADQLGSGASGRNGGLVLPGFTATNAELVDATSPEIARKLWDFSVAAVSLVKERGHRHTIACDLKSGVMTAAVTASHARKLGEDIEALRREYGYDGLTLLSAREARELVGSDRYHGGVLDRSAGHLHPLAFLRGLARAAEAAGARLFEQSPVRSVTENHVRSEQGSVTARHIVLAANVGIGDLLPIARPTVLPLRTFMIGTEPLAGAQRAATMPGSVAVYDTQVILNYFRLSSDHRLLFGGGLTAGPRSRAWIETHLRRAMIEVFPHLADLAIDYAWSGPLDMTENKLIQAGRVSDGIWFAQGFSGHGLALTVATGKALAAAIRGDTADFDLLSQARHRAIPGGRRLAPLTLPIGIALEKLRRHIGRNGFYSL